jgi:tRNA pseudouridine55 synthase
VRHAMATLTGAIEQVPPMYSALKVDGQPLYKRARAGEEVERSARPVHIHHFDLLGYVPGESAEISAAVLCSKGTYIRALAEDLGTALNLPAHVKTLRRTQAGPFGLTNAVTLAQLEAAVDTGSEDSLDALLLPVDASLTHLPSVLLSEAATFYLRKGQTVVVPNGPQSGMVRIAGAEGDFLGVGKVQEDGTLAPVRLLAQ